MDELYRRLLVSDDPVFDVGAPVGGRLACFRRLGCRVVAVEPQAAPLALFCLLHGLRRDREVTIEACALGAEAGEVVLLVNPLNSAVSTASPAFVRAAADAPGWHRQRWRRRVPVPLSTLDRLIARHGSPASRGLCRRSPSISPRSVAWLPGPAWRGLMPRAPAGGRH